MTHPYTVQLKSALLAGASAGLFAPLLWPLVILVMQGRIADWGVLLRGLVVVAGFAVAIGLIVSVVAAFPLLLLIHKFGVDRPLAVVCAGALISALALSKLMSWPIMLWPLYAFAAVVGGLCGLVAARYSRDNRPVAGEAPHVTH